MLAREEIRELIRVPGRSQDSFQGILVLEILYGKRLFGLDFTGLLNTYSSVT